MIDWCGVRKYRLEVFLILYHSGHKQILVCVPTHILYSFLVLCRAIFSGFSSLFDCRLILKCLYWTIKPRQALGLGFHFVCVSIYIFCICTCMYILCVYIYTRIYVCSTYIIIYILDICFIRLFIYKCISYIYIYKVFFGRKWARDHDVVTNCVSNLGWLCQLC